jgi:hypothetical protein
LKVQGDRNEIPDVLDSGGLAVEPSNNSGVGGEGVVIVIRELVVMGRIFAGLGQAMTIPESSGALLQVEGLSALMLECILDSTDAVLCGGGGFEELRVLRELLAVLNICRAQGGGFVFQALGGGEGLITELGRSGRGFRAGAGRVVPGGGHESSTRRGCNPGGGRVRGRGGGQRREAERSSAGERARQPSSRRRGRAAGRGRRDGAKRENRGRGKV